MIVPPSCGGCLFESLRGSSVLRSKATRALSYKLSRCPVGHVTHKSLMLMSSVGNNVIVIVMCAEGVEHVVLGVIDVMMSSEHVVKLGCVVVDPLHVLT